MKKLFLTLLAPFCFYSCSVAQSEKTISPYTSFLSAGHESAKDYILNLFNTHDIVIVCERTHTEMTQYDLFGEMISDKRFIEEVGNVFVEIGTSKLNPRLNDFLHTRNLSEDEIASQITGFQRNASMWPLWTEKNYFEFYRTIYRLNNSLPDNKQVNIYPSDIPFIWTEADSGNINNLKPMLAGRDSIIALQIMGRFKIIQNAPKGRRKALVIMNFRHAFNQAFPLPGGRTLHNVGWYLFNQYGNSVANVLLNSVSYGENNRIALVQDGKWDAAFEKIGKENAGFNFKGSPFGKDSLDIWPLSNPFTYADVFTGFAFYLPVEKHLLVEGRPGLFDNAFKPELLRRIHLISTVGGEFREKMADFERAVSNDPSFINTEESRKYFQIDSLLMSRSKWLKE
jgi:hypothetical protein